MAPSEASDRRRQRSPSPGVRSEAKPHRRPRSPPTGPRSERLQSQERRGLKSDKRRSRSPAIPRGPRSPRHRSRSPGRKPRLTRSRSRERRHDHKRRGEHKRSTWSDNESPKDKERENDPEKGKENKVERAEPKFDPEENPWEYMETMKAMVESQMGFRDFKSTKNTKVPGNDKLYAARKEKTIEYRQYMNRTGGFNRPLSPSWVSLMDIQSLKLTPSRHEE